jgi:hypothetical protein
VDAVPYLAALSALAGLGLAFYFYGIVKKADPGPGSPASSSS